MRPTTRRALTRRLPLGFAVILTGCPQLLDDRFGTVDGPDAGVPCSLLPCRGAGAAGVGGVTAAGSGGGGSASGSAGGRAGGAGGPSGAGGAGGPSGAGGAGGAATSGGAGGAIDTGGAGGDPGTSEPADAGGEPTVEPTPQCRILQLTDVDTLGSNCLGMSGWNDIAVNGSSDIELSFSNGDVCFDGNVVSDGWGAVYSMELASGADWNAASFGVDGFGFDMSGSELPPSLQITYVAGSDFCRGIAVGGSAELRFSDAHPNCATTGNAPNVALLRFMRVVFPVGTYPVDFCMQFRALAPG